MKLRTKYVLVTAGLVASVVASIAVTVGRMQRQVLEGESAERLNSVMEGVSRLGSEALINQDQLMLISYLMALQQEHSELAFASVTRRGHTAVLGKDRPGLMYLSRVVSEKNLPVTYTVTALPNPGGAPPAGSLSVTNQGVSLNVAGNALVKVSEPKVRETMEVRLGFVKSMVQESVERALKAMVARTVGVAGFFMGVGILAAIYLSQILTGPMLSLATAATAVAQGKLDAVVNEGSDEVGELGRRFNAMTASIKELMQFREDILHTLTHELNTPLGGLKGYLELWQGRKESDPANAAMVETMLSAVMNMEHSLGNALNLYQAASKHVAESARPRRIVWLRHIFAEIITLFEPVARAKKISLKGLSLTTVAFVHADEELLRQVIRNLVSNAIKYTPEGGLVRAALWDEAEVVSFAVEDSGYGIPPEALPHIFTKFYRAEGALARRIPGSGLGLNIAKQSVESMGGRIWAVSETGKGSTFYVALPKFPLKKQEGV